MLGGDGAWRQRQQYLVVADRSDSFGRGTVENIDGYGMGPVLSMLTQTRPSRLWRNCEPR